MVDLKDFTNKELINVIINWIRSGEHLNFANEYADSLEDGTWLEYYRNKIDNQPHYNS